MKIRFLKSAVDLASCPPEERPEIAIVGRSNAGKSSFLNAFTGSRIAKVSQQPGKTRLLNFFDIGEHYRFVDMPGYGFARRSGSEVISWKTMIESYIAQREALVGLLLIMDIRRDWTEQEAQLVEWLNYHQRPVIVILNKADKFGRGQQAQRRQKIKKVSGASQVFTVSCLKKTGVKEVEEYMFRNWIQAGESEQ